MKFLSSAAVAALVVMAASAAQAETVYGQVNVGGVVKGQTDIDVNIVGLGSGSGEAELEAGFLTSGLLGKTFDNGFSVEGEAIYAQSDLNSDELSAVVGAPTDASTSTVALMLNGKYEMATEGKFAPYVGAGLGFGKAKYTVDGDSDSDTGLVWQVKAGVALKQSDTVTWDLGYRYLRAPELTVEDAGDSISVQSSMHALTLGLRVGF